MTHRKRYLSTKISTDPALNELALKYGDFPVLLYTWLLPHTRNDGIVHMSPQDILNRVLAGRRDKDVSDVEQALAAIESVKMEVDHADGTTTQVPLLRWERDHDIVIFPASTFYSYQDDIDPTQRRTGWRTEDFPANLIEYDPPQEDEGGSMFLPWQIEDAKYQAVIKLCPTRDLPIAQEMIREAIRECSNVSYAETVQCMRYVLERFDTEKRNDWAKLFDKQLRWTSQAVRGESNTNLLSVSQMRKQWELDRQRSREVDV